MATIYEFGEFQLDTLRMLLIGLDGQNVSLPPRAFELLRIMIESGGRLLTKDELLGEVWHGTIVEEGNLTQSVSILRKALGESRSDHRYIVTVPGRGYRFVAEVHAVQLNDNLPQEQYPQVTNSLPAASANEEGSRTSRASFPAAEAMGFESNRARRWPVWIILIPPLLVAALSVYAAYSVWTMPPSPRPASVADIRSVAVLPFENIGGDTGDEYLGIGIADALITNLSNNRRVVVRPTNAVLRYSEAKPALTSVGRDLKVDALLDGRMQRLGDRVRVTVQLVRTSDGVPMWAEAFEDRVTNMFAVQDSISKKVAEALTMTLTGGERDVRSARLTDDSRAYEAYLRGRFFWNKRTGDGLQKSIEYFEEAVRLEPEFALAYAGLAESYVIINLYGAEHRRDAFPKARDAALKALALDSTLAPAQTALGLVKLEDEYDWPGAEASYRRALELNPNYATAHHWYGEYLAFLGRFDESVKHIERAYELDPASLVINTARGYPYMRSGRCDTAVEYFQKALELEPTFPLAHFYMGKCYVEKAKFEDAIREHTAAIEASGDSAMFMAALGYAYAASGKSAEARAVLKRMQESSRRRYVSPYSLATIHAGLSEEEEAFRWLGRAYEDRDYQLPTIKDDIHFVALRKDPRFAALLERIGLQALAK